MRPLDLAAIGIVLAASLLVVQATWTPPLITPAEATGHVGERVKMQGMAMDVRRFDDVTRFVLVADGAAIHARAQGVDVFDDTWVEVVATVDREGGRPLLRVEGIQQQPPSNPGRVDLVALGRDPGAYADRLIEVQGFLERGTLVGKGLALQTTATGTGAATISGVLRYEPPCLCYVLHAEPWTP